MDAIGGDQLTSFQIEAGPWFGHATEGHLLNGLARGGIHDGCDDTHRRADYGSQGLPSTACF